MGSSGFCSNAMRGRARAEAVLRLRVRGSLEAWARFALPAGHAPARHHRLLIGELEAVAAGAVRRLMVQMPPGSAKSTYASVLFPAWFLARHRAASVVAASHTASLAADFGGRVRGLLAEHGTVLGVRLRGDARASLRFGVEGGGGYFATGVRGPVTGRRADLLLIDDPVNGQAEADSPPVRDALWEWYRSDLLTRLRPGGRVVLVMTRWHPDDLGGRILAGEGDWRVLRLPALAEEDDPLGRAAGEPLWPEWEDAAALQGRRAAVGERAWAALYQQRPRLRQGGLFATSRIAVVEPGEMPEVVRRVRAWDLAATAAKEGTDPDWTVGVLLARCADGRFLVEDVVRMRGSPGEVEAAMQAAAMRDGAAVPIGLPQDPGQAGRSQVAYLVRQLAGYRATGSPESGSKEVRAMPVASQVEAGNFAMLRAGWNRAFAEELEAFPLGAKDDQVDALSRAFGMLVAAAEGGARAARGARVALIGR